MKKVFSHFLILTCLISLLVLPYFVFAAASPSEKMENIALQGGYNLENSGEDGISNIIGTIITSILSLLGVIFLVLMVYAGYLWMMARGDSGQVDKARDILSRAIIGLVIVIGAYAITRFVYAYLIDTANVIS